MLLRFAQAQQVVDAVAEPETAAWRVGDDVVHPWFGHGWVQGAGHGVVSVRFETRASALQPLPITPTFLTRRGRGTGARQ